MSGDSFTLLERLTSNAEAQWPTFRLERAAFHKVLLEVAAPGEQPTNEQLAKLHVGDLYLATACAEGIPAAINEFVTRYLSRIGAYVQRLGTAICADEVRRDLEDTLLFGRGGSPPRIAQYAGRGPLEGWVSTAARNTALSLLRVQQRGLAEDFDDLASHLALPAEGCRGVVTHRYERVIQDAVRAALAALSLRERTIVKLHLVQGVTLTQIGRMLQVHQTTVGRSFEAALESIYDEIRRRLQELEGVDPSELRSIIRDVRSRIDLSLSRYLRDPEGG